MKTKLVGKAADIVEVVTRRCVALRLQRRLGCSFYDFTERLLRVVLPSSIFLVPCHPPFVFVVNVPRSSSGVATARFERAIQNLGAYRLPGRKVGVLFIYSSLYEPFISNRVTSTSGDPARRTRTFTTVRLIIDARIIAAASHKKDLCRAVSRKSLRNWHHKFIMNSYRLLQTNRAVATTLF